MLDYMLSFAMGFLLFVAAATTEAQITVKESEWNRGNVFICDTQEQIFNIVEAHTQFGLEEARQVAALYGQAAGLLPNSSACGSAENIVFMVTDVLWQGSIDNQPAVVVEIAIATSADSVLPVPQYTVLHNTVFEKQPSF